MQRLISTFETRHSASVNNGNVTTKSRWILSLAVTITLLGIAVQSASASPFSDAVNALSPVGYWQFESDWTDSASSNDLTPFSLSPPAPSFTAGPGLPGLSGIAADFRDGGLGSQRGAYVTGLNAGGNALDLSGATYSINAWVSNDEALASFGFIATQRGAAFGADVNYSLAAYVNPFANPDATGMRAITGGVIASSEGVVAGADSGWHMLTVTVDLGLAGSEATFYMDGVLHGTASVSGTALPGSGTDFIVGNQSSPTYSDYNGNDLSGRIDELAVFGSALSAGQVANLYAAATVPEPASAFLWGTGLVGLLAYARRQRRCILSLAVAIALLGTVVPSASASPFSDAVNALSPAGYWQFENTGYTDSSGNGNTLTPFGTVGITPGPGLLGLPGNAVDLRHAGGQQGLSVATGVGNALNLTGTQYSINAWVSNDEPIGSFGMIAVNRNATWPAGGWNYGNSVTNYGDASGVNQGQRAWTSNSTGIETYYTGSDLNWHMLTVSVDLSASPQATFYVDGASVGSASIGATTLTGPGSWFVVGNNSNNVTADYGPSDLNGRIDELAVFGSALSAAQVSDLYIAATAPIPEPTSACLLGMGFVGLLACARRRRQ